MVHDLVNHSTSLANIQFCLGNSHPPNPLLIVSVTESSSYTPKIVHILIIYIYLYGDLKLLSPH